MTGAWQAGVDNGPQVDGTGRAQIPAMWLVVQLGGLEPPTSCSTDRRSNQLSYNCILGAAPKKGVRTGRKLGATPGFGKAGRCPVVVAGRALKIPAGGPWGRESPPYRGS